MADIGVPGPQRTSLVANVSGLPWANPVQPALGAGDPSGLTQDTCIQVPALAAGAKTTAPARQAIAAISQRNRII
jgi:hypothetical protein